MKEKDLGLDNFVDSYIFDRLQEAITNVEDIKDRDEINIDEVRDLVKKANYWIKDTAIDEDGSFNQDLYDSYKYRVFIRPETVTIIQGRPYDVETGEWKNIP